MTTHPGEGMVEMQLVSNGKPLCGLDVLPGATPPLQYAADELIRFVDGKTGCQLPRSDSEEHTISIRLAGDGGSPAPSIHEVGIHGTP